MPKGNKLSRLLIATLAGAALAAPAAMAQPTEPVDTAKQPATKTADLRGEAAVPGNLNLPRPPAWPESGAIKKDLRSEAAADPSRGPALPRDIPGPPTWPMHPKPIVDVQAPVADDGDGGGIEAPIVALIIAGTLALGGGLTAAALRHRTRVAA